MTSPAASAPDNWPRVMICGSRTWRDAEAIRNVICQLPAFTVVMEGEAGGADEIVHDAAHEFGYHVEAFPPDPRRPSPQRYHERNDAMLAKANRVIAFWDGKSRGTKSVIDKARERGIEVEVVHA